MKDIWIWVLLANREDLQFCCSLYNLGLENCNKLGSFLTRTRHLWHASSDVPWSFSSSGLMLENSLPAFLVSIRSLSSASDHRRRWRVVLPGALSDIALSQGRLVDLNEACIGYEAFHPRTVLEVRHPGVVVLQSTSDIRPIFSSKANNKKRVFFRTYGRYSNSPSFLVLW